jgi:hypothetical protein
MPITSMSPTAVTGAVPRPSARSSRQVKNRRIEPTAKREADLSSGHPDYSIWAGEQRIGRIYQQHALGCEQWFWGLNTVTLDTTVGVGTHGTADSFDDAKIKFRFAFDHWHDWALALPRGDMKYPRVSAELMKMSAAKRLVSECPDKH